MNSAGNTEVSVLERMHIQFTVTSLTGIYDTRVQSVQVLESIVLPSDRRSSAGMAVVEGDVFLRDEPGVPAPVCNLRLVKGLLMFIIMSPEVDSDPYFVAVNIPSRIKVSYTKPEVPVPRKCYHSVGQHRRAFSTNYRDILLLVEDEASVNLGNVTLQQEEHEVHLPLHQRSRLDYLEWSLKLRLSNLSTEVQRTRCIQSLRDDYSL